MWKRVKEERERKKRELKVIPCENRIKAVYNNAFRRNFEVEM